MARGRAGHQARRWLEAAHCGWPRGNARINLVYYGLVGWRWAERPPSREDMMAAGQAAQPEIGRSIAAGGGATNFPGGGGGGPVILLHGSGPGVSAWANWRAVLPYLAERLHVFAYDQLGFGFTELPADPHYGLDAWV